MEFIRRWRRAAAWSPVFWFPVALYFLLTERLFVALTLFLAGLIFAGVARAIVASRRCPACQERFGGSGAQFRSAWNESSCGACGLSLFDLRREAGDDV